MKTAYKVLYTFSYMAIGALTPLIGQHLSETGYGGTQIGIITGAGTLTAIVAVAVWGRIYNTAIATINILMLLCLCAPVLGLLVSGAGSFGLVLILFCTMYFFQAPVMSLVDSFTVLGDSHRKQLPDSDRESCTEPEFSKAGKGFGGKRAWGAVGFALGVLISGRLAGLLDTKVIFYIYSTAFAVTFITLAAMKLKRKDYVGKRETFSKEGLVDRNERNSSGNCRKEGREGYINLFRNRRVVQLLICMFFMGGTNVANNTFFSFLYIDGGGTVAGVGVAMLLMVGSEVPFMTWCDRLSAKFTMEKTILAAMIISAVRFSLYGIGLPWWVLLALFFTQGMVNGIILVEFVRYIVRLAGPEMASLAISAYYIIGSNISTILCQLVGGMILDVLGAPGVYCFFGIFNAIGVLLYLLFGLHKSKDY